MSSNAPVPVRHSSSVPPPPLQATDRPLPLSQAPAKQSRTGKFVMSGLAGMAATCVVQVRLPRLSPLTSYRSPSTW